MLSILRYSLVKPQIHSDDFGDSIIFECSNEIEEKRQNSYAIEKDERQKRLQQYRKLASKKKELFQ